MKISIKHQQLSSCLDYVVTAVPSARVDSILSHVLIRVAGNNITMIGTNHEIQITALCEGKISGEQERIVPADKLRRVLNTFGGDTLIKMEFLEEEVQITADKSKFKIMTQNADRFTPLGETSEMEVLETISGEVFLEAITKVQYSAAEESHRRSLNGILLQRSGKSINFVGTDGHRMAVKTIDAAGKGDNSYIIPVKTIQALSKNISADNEVQISANDRVVRFSNGQFELISNVIQEVYPDYQHVIPRNNEKKAIIEREQLKKSLDRVMALSDNNAIAHLEFDKSKLKVSCNNADNDSLVEMLDVNYNDEKITIVLNAIYLTQFLNVCKEQMIEISMSTAENSVLLHPVEDVQSLIYVVMPVRT